MDPHNFPGLDALLSEYPRFVVVEFCAGTNYSNKPSLDDLKATFKDVKFARLSLGSIQDFAWSGRYNIRNTPTFALFKDKEIVELIGANELDTINGAIKKHAPPVQEKPEETTPPSDVLPARALEHMWNSPALANADSRGLPSSSHLEDALSQLRITLLPKTQHKAVHIVDGSHLVEPSLALFCPLEGGEFVIDATVKHLAEKTESEVQVIDMAQVAAGEWGVFGKLASGFRFKNNSLGKVKPNEDLDDDDEGDKNQRALEVFWRTLIESNPPAGSASTTPADDESCRTPTGPRSRIIYIRDFGLLAPRVHSWFPPLYNALRAHRTGGLGSWSPIANPTTVIFGVSPRVSSVLPTSAEGGGCNCDSCRPPTKEWDESASKERKKRLKDLKDKWDKGQLSKDLPSFKPVLKIMKRELEAEKRLHAEKEKEQAPKEQVTVEESMPTKGEALGELVEPASEPMTKEKEDIVDDSKADMPAETEDEPEKAPEAFTESESQKEPQFETKPAPEKEPEPETSDEDKPEPEKKPDDSDNASTSQSSTSSDESSSEPAHEQKVEGYFRSCIIAPAKRSAKLERAAREGRRRELNELMLRMIVGIKGGEIEHSPAPVPIEKESEEKVEKDKDNEDEDMVKAWEERLLDANTLTGVVDRALELAMLSNEDDKEKDPVRLTWAQFQDAWRAKRSSDRERKAWTKLDDDSEEGDDEDEEKPPVDEVVEKVKSADLDEYEQRLLGCIVDVARLTTTFENVHLPPQVIDSVRSIVSLPLLYPDAFKSGILKQQAISGALLFGPPGTGKTLVVRALAKESGSRMLAIKPSDIADKWVGETEKLVRSIFKLARRLKPCVVFIDEIDSIMGSRMGKSCSGSSRWHTSMLTEFMQEMDGLMASSVIVIGATNRPFDIDDAVLRRLPCRLLVDLPGVEAREEILKIMLRDDKLAPDVDIKELARRTDRFSGSDIKHLCVAAAMDALKETVKLPWLAKKDDSNDAAEAKSDDASKQDSDSSDGESWQSVSDPKSKSASSASTGASTPAEKAEPIKPRILNAAHFQRALMDVAPSSSESQGSLSELRKWNTQFGTGGRDQPRKPGSLSYIYGGGNSSLPGSTAIPGVNGISGYSTGGPGSTGLGSAGLRASALSSSRQGSGALGSGGFSGVGSSSSGSLGLGSSRLGPSGLDYSSLGGAGLGSTGPSYPTGVGDAKLGVPGVSGYVPPNYVPPGTAGTFEAGAGKFPVYGRTIPGYTPGAPGGGPPAPGT